MRIISVEGMVRLEEEVLARGISAADLMERAGEGMARRILNEYPGRRYALVFAGKGNNGGDALVVARHLARAGWLVRVALAWETLGDLPSRQLHRLRETCPDVEVGTYPTAFPYPSSDGVVIDGLLGVGSQGPLRHPLIGIANAINEARAARFFRTVALDAPTGWLGREEEGAAVIADLTLTVGFPKEPLAREEAAPWVGRLEVIPLFEADVPPGDELLVPWNLAGLLPRRSAAAHKGNFGRIVIVGGSAGFSGAPCLAALGALRGGAGLVHVRTEPAAAPETAARAPLEAMVAAWSKRGFEEALAAADAVAAGPGMGTDDEARAVLRTVLRVARSPVVLDADALSLLGTDRTWRRQVAVPLVLTPHPGEMRRLLGRDFEPPERADVAREMADALNAVVVLKGCRTVIAAPGGRRWINGSGNPGLATGGAGDLLTGLIASLIGQGLLPADAARFAVWWHGRAADLALQARHAEESLLPTDVAAHLGAALADLRAGAAPPVLPIEAVRA